MLYEIFRSKLEEKIPVFGGAGPIAEYKAMQAQAGVDEYISKLEGGEHISTKGRAFAPPSIREEYFSMSHSGRYNTRLLSRAFDGFYSTCHVFAYISGMEKSYGENWDKQNRICANTVCKFLHIPPIYKGDDVKNIDLDIEDFTKDGPRYRPIVTIETLLEAYKRFPFDLNIIKNDKKSKEEKNEFIERIEDKESVNEPEVEDAIIDLTFSEINNDGDVKESNNKSAEEKTEEPTKEPETVVNKFDNDGDVEESNDKSTEEKTEEPTKKPETVVVKFDNDKMVIYPDEDIETIKVPSNQEKKVNDLFGKYLSGFDYQINKFATGALECVIRTKDNMFISHIIDPGLSVGDGYYVLAVISTGNPNKPFDTIPVHYSEDDILKNVFGTTDHKYVLTPDEYQKALGHLFKNHRIYNVIDMSPLGGSIAENTKIGRIKKKPEDFRKLGQKLTFIINIVDNTPMLGRMRFSKFTSIDNFELRSDDVGGKIRSPFPGDTLETKSGVVIQVNGDDVNIIFRGNNQTYHIDNYGVL